MRSLRIEMALDSGAWVLPDSGDIAVYHPRIGDDLTALPKDRVVVLTGFKPDHDHFAGLGYRVASVGQFATALICVSRAKAEARALLAEACLALRPGAVMAVDGQKTDGVEAVLKDCKALGLDLGEAVTKGHGRLATVPADARLLDWAAQDHLVDGFVTRPGVFSADGPDHGSVMLAQALPQDLRGRVGDLGAGWGYLSRTILARPRVTHVDVVEADATALDCARRNLSSPLAQFHWADARGFRPEKLWSAVVMNPPFHNGRAADPALGIAFIRAAHKGLAPDGVLWMVANRHLPYEPVLRDLFRVVEVVQADGSFAVTRAAFPVRAKR
ncbi:MAG: class I SAM-dependent methyltransferase [Candidatus Saccharibacteria bacterium]|nr:class I SAM-dependent methyltransferase [Pseudorhodobacter sp.]